VTLALVVLATGLLYARQHLSIWATIGNLAILGVLLAYGSVMKPRITGRAQSLPPIERSAIGSARLTREVSV
jgi:hypothetical protein